jgi:hypothetical protein
MISRSLGIVIVALGFAIGAGAIGLGAIQKMQRLEREQRFLENAVGSDVWGEGPCRRPDAVRCEDVSVAARLRAADQAELIVTAGHDNPYTTETRFKETVVAHLPILASERSQLAATILDARKELPEGGSFCVSVYADQRMKFGDVYGLVRAAQDDAHAHARLGPSLAGNGWLESAWTGGRSENDDGDLP